jgi:uncharacterized protein
MIAHSLMWGAITTVLAASPWVMLNLMQSGASHVEAEAPGDLEPSLQRALHCTAETGLGRYRIKAAEEACAAGSVPCCLSAGDAHQLGRFGVSDSGKARQLFEVACNAGSGGGCLSLSIIYRNGDGLPPDPVRADALLERAAELYTEACGRGEAGHCGAYADLIQAKIMPQRTDQDPKRLRERARALLADACRLGDAQACTSLAIRRDALGAAAKIDMPLLEKACAAGDGRGCFIAAFEQPRWKENDGPDRVMVDYLVRSCELGNEKGCEYAGGFYARGEGVGRDLDKAISLYESGCTGGLVSACTGLARTLRLPGRTQNLGRAEALLHQACDAGWSEACAAR